MIGLVLAGGKSSRFEKGAKALYYDPRFQTTWTEVAVSTLLSVTSEVYVSVNTQNTRQLQQILKKQSVTLLTDQPEFAHQGPLSGLYTASCLKPDESILVTAVDYPEITAASLQILAANANCYAVDSQGNSHFTLGHFQFELQLLENYLRSGQRRVGSFLKLIFAEPCLLPDNQLLNHNQK